MKKKTVAVAIIAAAVLLGAIFALLVLKQKIHLNNPSDAQYPVKGIDVSSYQGEIDWEVLSKENISFAYIKATEGSSFIDSNFAYNYEEANKTDLRVGAYHFFSFDSEGRTQADNYISVVGAKENMLPPVVDFEFYGDKAKNPPDVSTTEKELRVLLETLEDYYKVKPVIYATERTYRDYLKGKFDDYDIWIRNVYFRPLHGNWKFWQYSCTGELKGYIGKEKYVDLNVFNGSRKEFETYGH